MRNNTKLLFLVFLIGNGSLLIYSLVKNKEQPAKAINAAPLFQLAGHGTQTVTRAITKLIPIGSLDEKAYGDAIAARYDRGTDKNNKKYQYVKSVFSRISKHGKKKFKYRTYVARSRTPNAYAYPGGVIVVTTELLNIVKNEAELAGILSHELGHVELSHSFDAVKFQLLAKKMKVTTLGKLADFTQRVILRHSYSKTQENESDDFAFELLKESVYDPHGVGESFKSLLYASKHYRRKENQKGSILSDYLKSHPSLEIRSQKYKEKANNWWKNNKVQKRYIGAKNISSRTSFNQKQFPDEWTSYKKLK